MVNQQVLAHHWDDVCDKLRQRWTQLSADDLAAFTGNLDQLVAWIREKTGEQREAIEAFLERAVEEGNELAGEARLRLRAGAERVSETARHGAETVREGYKEARRFVERHPRRSMAAAFGLGVVCGLGIAAVLRGSQSRPAKSVIARGRAATGRWAAKCRTL